VIKDILAAREDARLAGILDPKAFGACVALM